MVMAVIPKRSLIRTQVAPVPACRRPVPRPVTGPTVLAEMTLQFVAHIRTVLATG